MKAENGQQAVHCFEESLVKQTPFDAIFMDEIMPIMKGSEAISIIRRLGYTGKIISITGNVMDEDSKTILDSGADFVVAKPLKFQDLQQKILSKIKFIYSIYCK